MALLQDLVVSNSDLTNQPTFTVNIIPLGSWVPGNPLYTITRSNKVNGGSNPLLNAFVNDDIGWTVTDCSLPGATLTSPGQGAPDINNDSNKINARKGVQMKCMKKFANGTCAGVFTTNSTPPTTIPCSCTFIITNAGQSKVRGN